MSFTYENLNYKYISNYQFSRSYLLSGSHLTNSTPLLKPDINNPEKRSRTTTQVINDFIVSKISYNETIVEFNYAGETYSDCNYCNGGRKDLNGGKKLKEIIIKYKPLNETEKIIKQYKINTSYTESSTGAPSGAVYLPDYPSNTFTNRLRLDSITELYSQSKYSFDYEDDKQLPARFSQYADWWGSYTKPKYMNSEYLPSFIYKRTMNSELKYFDGANKDPDIEYAKTGSLKRVHFPTGGYQEFHYGLDEYKYNSSEIKYEPLYFNMSPETWISTNPNQVLSLPVITPDYRNGFDYELTFVTNHVNCEFDINNNPNNNLPNGRYFRINLYKKVGGNDIFIKDYIVDNYAKYQLPEFEPNQNYHFTISTLIGSDCTVGNNTTGVVNITPQINYVHESEPIHINNKTAGHLRVDSITLHDSNGLIKIKRSFEYKNFENPVFSSGVFMGIPIHKKQYSLSPGISIQCPSAMDPICKSTNRDLNEIISNNPSLNLNFSYGKSVFYENVAEIYEDLKEPSNNYRKEYIFQLPNKEGYPEHENPTTYFPHNGYTGGRVLEERYHNNTFNPIAPLNSLVKKITYAYSDPDNYFNSQSADYQGDSYISFGLTAALEGFSAYDCGTIGCQLGYEHGTNVYYITSGWVKHLSTTEENYENGVLKMTNTTNYEYDNTYSHLNPVRVKSTNSLGQEVKTEYKYNHAYKKDEPTETISYENGSPVSIRKTTFNSANLPQYVFAKKGSSTLDDTLPSEDLKITYERYDAQGNLQQYRLADGIPVSIIWGYNGQYPIAKVEGVAYADIETQAATLANNNNLTESSFNSLRTLVNHLTDNSKFGMLTCYIYEPLVGVKMIIQPNGQKEIYEYDSAGRLMKVKDQNEKELKKIDYHYKLQP